MSIRNILVAYNGSESSDAAVRSAVLAHEKHGAHVTGLLAHRSAKERLREETWIPQSIQDTLDDLEEEAHAKIRQQFLGVTDGRIAPDKLHWIARYGDADATIADYARMFDITVMGRFDSLKDRRRMELHPDRVALKSGRPVLVVPRKRPPEDIRKRVVLAWDGQRAASRALNDGMQIFESRQAVTVLTVETEHAIPELSGIDVKTALERHGVDVDIARMPRSDKGVAQTILDYCEAQDAGLLVMGAFEHSVFKEQLLGGVTRHILEQAQIPVLMSH